VLSWEVQLLVVAGELVVHFLELRIKKLASRLGTALLQASCHAQTLDLVVEIWCVDVATGAD